jgi:hypothetical protein
VLRKQFFGIPENTEEEVVAEKQSWFPIALSAWPKVT